jgi:hypothetical protein
MPDRDIIESMPMDDKVRLAKREIDDILSKYNVHIDDKIRVSGLRDGITHTLELRNTPF